MSARPIFSIEPVLNRHQSEKEGRPIYDDKEMVKVIIPGDRNMNFVSVVEDKHKERWPKEYEAFKRGEQIAASGTPLEHWPNPTLTVGRVAELKALNILSVEDLAGVSDANGEKLGMGWRELREQARAYIDAAASGAKEAQLAAENAALLQRIELLEAQVGAQASEPAPVQQEASTPEPTPQEMVQERDPAQGQEKTLDDCSDEELADFIERATGEKPVDMTRDQLLEAAMEIATAPEAA